MKNKKNDLRVTAQLSLEAGKQLNKGRRKALFGVATGASIITWHKPIINSVVLPAHAQTSSVISFFGASVTANPVASTNSLLDILVPEAIAGVVMTPDEYTISIEPVGTDGAAFTISLFEDLGETQDFSVAQVVYSGEVSVASGGSLSPTDNPCDLTDLVDIDVEITSVNENEIVLNLTNRAQSLTVPAGDGMLPSPMCTDLPLAASYFQPGRETQVGISEPSSSPLLDLIIPQANAGQPSVQGSDFGLSAVRVGMSDDYMIEMLSRDRDVLRTGTVNIDGSSGSLVPTDPNTPCARGPVNIPARVDSIDETEMVLVITRNGGGDVTLMVPAASGTLTATCLVQEEQPD